ncbi:DUF2062 domain-containing protein [Leptolyngbya cf. ectocarpi LEGE 11479]|uniref:DUF2062 domain-containing protein n=1 Tax=Leptolyngbya cf. ectocarpi LEGE 11479 TaxID=1828722 RepID=A0A928X0F7_LEPEC|nr:DUF2062 domain-containing protein [Leptolyngbya ectocarpi]MBE9066729.1 DUF2062 domain-containing protein [Leptolyngbya cf. ectocarpi LEGE 11479]
MPKGSRSAHRSHRTLRKKRPNLRRLVRYIYIRFIRLQSHPQAIAKGLAAGVFAGSYPLFGLQTFLGVAIAAAIGGNKIVAAAGTWISNPLTYLPIYAFNYQIGRWFLGQSANTSLTNQSPQEWMSLGFDITIALMVGSTLVGSLLAIISYYASLRIAHKARKIKSNRRSIRPKETRNRTHL